MFFQNINYIAVIVAAVISVAAGFLWYAPWSFGPLWMKSKGWTDDVLRAKKEGKSMAPTYIGTLAAAVISAIVIAALFNSLIITSIGGMVLLGFCLWIGIVVPVKLGDYFFGGDTFTFFLISVGYQLVSLVLISLIIGIWG